MTDEDRNALIRLPSGTMAGLGPKRILSGMVSDALDVARSHDSSLALARFRIGDHEFREPDYRQLLLWSKALELDPAVIVQRLETPTLGRHVNPISFLVRDGAIEALVWDFSLLPIRKFEWVDGLVIRCIGFTGAATASLLLRLPLLDRLSCWGIGLTKLDLSNVPMLSSLQCGGNQLSELDLSIVPLLDELEVDKNKVTELSLSHVPLLSRLSCGDNQLTALDLSRVPLLSSLSCNGNQLTALDLSSVPELRWLACGSNQLSELSLSHVPLLRFLFCFDNQLAKLDLSHVSLRGLSCAQNQLTELDIRAQPGLLTLQRDPSVKLRKRASQKF